MTGPGQLSQMSELCSSSLEEDSSADEGTISEDSSVDGRPLEDDSPPEVFSSDEASSQEAAGDGGDGDVEDARPLFSQSEERELINWVLDGSAVGLHMDPNLLCHEVFRIVQSEQRGHHKSEADLNSWTNALIKRYSDSLSHLPGFSTNGDKPIASDTYTDVWRNTLSTHGLLDAPSRIFCIEQVDIRIDASTATVIGGGPLSSDKSSVSSSSATSTSSKHAASSSSPCDRTSHVTYTLAVSADGACTPPLLVYPPDLVRDDITDSDPPCQRRTSSNGLMTPFDMLMFMMKTLDGQLSRQGVRRPVAVFVDGQRHCSSLALRRFCKDERIHLLGLPPALCDVSPARVAIAGLLAANVEHLLVESRVGRRGGRASLSHVLAGVRLATKRVCPQSIVQAYGSSGLYPWNSDILASHQRRSCTASPATSCKHSTPAAAAALLNGCTSTAAASQLQRKSTVNTGKLSESSTRDSAKSSSHSKDRLLTSDGGTPFNAVSKLAANADESSVTSAGPCAAAKLSGSGSPGGRKGFKSVVKPVEKSGVKLVVKPMEASGVKPVEKLVVSPMTTSAVTTTSNSVPVKPPSTVQPTGTSKSMAVDTVSSGGSSPTGLDIVVSDSWSEAAYISPLPVSEQRLCAMRSCSLSLRRDGRVRLYPFPEQLQLRQRWLQHCQLPLNTPVFKLAVCMRHFRTQDFVDLASSSTSQLSSWHRARMLSLRPSAVPRRMRPDGPRPELTSVAAATSTSTTAPSSGADNERPARGIKRPRKFADYAPWAPDHPSTATGPRSPLSSTIVGSDDGDGSTPAVMLASCGHTQELASKDPAALRAIIGVLRAENVQLRQQLAAERGRTVQLVTNLRVLADEYDAGHVTDVAADDEGGGSGGDQVMTVIRPAANGRVKLMKS